MNRFKRILSCVLLVIFVFSIVSCSGVTDETVQTAATSIGDNVSIYSVIAETRSIMDDESMRFSISCNYYADVDNSTLNIQVIDPTGNVIHESNEVFLSGKTYSTMLTANELGIDRFAGGDYIVSVSNTFNTYVGIAIVHTILYPENSVIVARDEIKGVVNSSTYTNEYFGIKFECPRDYYIDDYNYDTSDNLGYTYDLFVYPESDRGYVFIMLGHAYYDNEPLTFDNLAMYCPFDDEPEETEIITINDIEFLSFELNGVIFYMTYKDSDVFIVAHSASGEADIELIRDAIKPID